MPQVLVLVQALVSVQLPREGASPPQGLAWELPAVRELLRELPAVRELLRELSAVRELLRELSALWVQEKLGV